MRTSFDTIVVGSGIVGAACAAAFARDGLSVALVDRAPSGLGATSAGMGHIVLMDDSTPQFLLTQLSQALWRTLASRLPSSAEYQTSGTLWVAADDEEMREVVRKQALYRSYGVSTDVLDASQLRTLEPHLRPDLTGALLVPSDAVVYAPLVARLLAEDAVAHGALVVSGDVVRIGEGSVDLRGGQRLRSTRIVNAAGERSAELTPGIPVRRRKGHLAITDRYPNFVSHQIVELGYLKSAHSIGEDSVAFNVQPRMTGQVLIGSSRQYDATSPEIEHSMLARMLTRAVAYMPDLADVSILRTWTGFRAATPDKLPLIGPWPEDDTVFLATGHEGLGITTSLATASLLSDCFAGRATAIPLEPYLPARVLSEVSHA
ncbi:NAD(P)/FAD-dependent oxidoreductase [Granulicella arctica]|uniref:NAD(P)/FAD-dependent oxidoreductase n=1 Tax=Granulicella arctica TaxID=940613 RepID=UPI0021E0F802|nr:FAD-dependent oxidoreductase [Granulicella arctica]